MTGEQKYAELAFNVLKEVQPLAIAGATRLEMGRLAPGAPGQKYDNQRAGWIWALMLYPPDVKAQNPAVGLGRAHFDQKTGGYFFRNRWQDGNDILCAIFTDLANHQAWDKREATSIVPLAHGAYSSRYLCAP